MVDVDGEEMRKVVHLNEDRMMERARRVGGVKTSSRVEGG